MIDVSPTAGYRDDEADVQRPSAYPPKCYACDAILDKAGAGPVPLCLKCRGGDGEKTPVAMASVDLGRDEGSTYTYRTEACCGMPVLAQSSRGLNVGLEEHAKSCAACRQPRFAEKRDAFYAKLAAEIESSMSAICDEIARDDAEAYEVRGVLLQQNSTRAEPDDGGNGGQTNATTYLPEADDRD